jgi:hypothetical protein
MRRTGLVLLVVLGGVPFARAQRPVQSSPTAQNVLAATPAPVPAEATAPPPALTLAPENLVSFDYRQADLRWENGGWVVMAGNVRVKDFGNHPLEAREGLRLIRDLRLTQHGVIGTPVPVMEYWLSDGQAPQPLNSRQWLWPIDPEHLRVEQVQGHWCVRDADRLLFAFGSHADQAQQALAVLRHYQFTQVGYVGQPVPDMMYFVAGPALTVQAATLAAHAVDAGHIAQPKFPVVIGATNLSDRKPATDDPTGAKAQARLLAQLQVRQLDRAGFLAPDPGFLGDRVPFDWRQVQLRRQERDWVLASGSTVLANFGANEMDARQALRAIEYYRFTEERRVGSPNPVFTYFLTGEQAAHGAWFGLPSVSFRPETLKVQALGGAWTICDETRVLLTLHGDEADACRVKQIIQQEHFDTLCQVGSAGPGTMAFLVRAH